MNKMAVETYVNTITSSFGIDHSTIDCKVTRRLVVSLRMLSESKENSSINKNDSINSASNTQTKSNELTDVDKNLSANVYLKSSLLNKGIKKSQSKIKACEKQDIKTGIQFNTSLDNIYIDNFKTCSKGTELSVDTKQILPDEHFPLPNFTKFSNKTPIENHISDESPLEMEDQESALLYNIPMESESNFFQESDKKTDHESFISKCKKIYRGRIEDTQHFQVNTSSLYKLKNGSTTSNINSMPSKIKNKKSLSPKDQLLMKEMIESRPNSKFKESSLLFKIKRQNIDYLDSCSTKITKFHEGNISQTHRRKIVGMQSEAFIGIQSINEKNMNNKPIEELKFAKVLPYISINSHLLFSVIIISFESDGIRLNFSGPEFETSSKSCSVLLSDAVVEQLFIYCNKCSDAFISIVTSSACGRHLRKYLKLNEKSIPSYSNNSKTKNQLKISFLMQNVVDGISNFICSLFSATKLNIIKHKAALTMLTLSSSFKNSPPQPTSCRLVYPAVGGIQVKEEDVAYLAVGKRINDTIIDFYLNYIYNEIIPAEFQARTHIFSSFFYKFLLRAFAQKHTDKNGSDVHRSVNKWIKNVDIFSKDFIFVPMNRRNHWYLVVICFLTQLNQNSYEEINLEDSSIETKKSSDKSHSGSNSPNTRRKDYPYLNKGKPCVVFFDSLDKSTILKADKKVVAETLKRFLKMLWNTKNPNKPYDWGNLLCLKAVCPQQENGVDCGLYLLQYVESFFKNPIPYFGNPMPVLKNWFPKNYIIHKRTQIKKVISQLRAKQPKTVQLEPSCSSDVIALS